ncbi:serine/threonine protein phosphatase [Sphingomonas sp. ACRSK]|nr:metallophosphoesterase family protein [Sphingomonas sp. ACRSK]MCG7349810.1 serine/threonine protein phosphatase [Sphingomonas sp. ACRSK]
MLTKLLFRRQRASVPAARVPEGRKLYAIGDIHGRFDLLDGLLEQIFRDEAARGGPAGELIFLGDLVDRGPESAQVIDRLIALKAERPGVRVLLGNHEEVFLGALAGDAKALRLFSRIGGEETILSYGVSPQVYAHADYDELYQLLIEAVPETHRAFLESCEDMIVAGDYVFVHAGIRPGVPLAEQRPSDLRWIREEFLRARAPLEKRVVHGHTISEEIVDLPHRLGLDTGAYRSGILSAMGFQGEKSWILQELGSRVAVAA